MYIYILFREEKNKTTCTLSHLKAIQPFHTLSIILNSECPLKTISIIETIVMVNANR